MNAISSVIIGVVTQAEADLQGFSTPVSKIMGLSAMAITYLCLKKLPKFSNRIYGTILFATAVKKAKNPNFYEPALKSSAKIAAYVKDSFAMVTYDLFHNFQNAQASPITKNIMDAADLEKCTDRPSEELRRDNIDNVLVYLENGGEPNLRDENGYFVIELAFLLNRFDIARALIEKGAMVDCKYQFSLLDFALRNNHIDIARLLIEKGAFISDQDYRNLLRLASVEENPEIVEWMTQFHFEKKAMTELDEQAFQHLFNIISKSRNPKIIEQFESLYSLDRVSIVRTAIINHQNEFAHFLVTLDSELLVHQALQQRVAEVILFLEKNHLAEIESLLKKVDDAKRIEFLGYLSSLAIITTGSMANHVLKIRKWKQEIEQGIENVMQALNKMNMTDVDIIQEELNKIDAILSNEENRKTFASHNPLAMGHLFIARGLFSLCDADFSSADEYLEEAQKYVVTEKMKTLILSAQEFIRKQETEIKNQELVCPISYELMQEPVKYIKNNHTFYFERDQILMTIQETGKCPFTNQDLSENELQEAPEKVTELVDYKESLIGAVRELMS